MRTVLFFPLRDLHPVVGFRHVEDIADDRQAARAWGEREPRGVHPAVVQGTGVEEGDVAEDDGGDEHVEEVELPEGKVERDIQSLRVHVELVLGSNVDGFLIEYPCDVMDL